MAAKKESSSKQLPTGPAGDKKAALETALAQIEKQFGKGAVMKLGTNVAMQVDAISTGSLGLDLALGIGGLPGGSSDLHPRAAKRTDLCCLWAGIFR